MSPATGPAAMRRNVFLLCACQALFMSGNALLLAASALVGLALAPHAGLATVPLGFQFLASMSATMPASLLMQRIGRRGGFLVGLGLGIAGAALCAVAIVERSFEGFVAGSFLVGIYSGFGQFYRFAAADVADDEYRSRAISLVMAGGVVAAFAGPNLALWTRDMVVLAPFAASFASIVVLHAATAVALAFVRVPPAPRTPAGATARPIAILVRQPRFMVAVLSGTVGFASMNLLMTSTPLAMLGCGYEFDSTATVIQWHVLGMFAPAFVTGHLIRRFGVLEVIVAGAVLQIGAVAVNVSGTAIGNFWLALTMLGVGWNFLFVGATTLVTQTYEPWEKAKVQGLNDLIVFGMVAVTAASSGFAHDAVGWTVLNLAVTPFLAITVLACAWLSRRPVALAI